MSLKHITNLVRAGFPLVYLQTHEEKRTDFICKSIADDEELVKKLNGYHVYVWRYMSGLYNALKGSLVEGCGGPASVLDWVMQWDDQPPAGIDKDDPGHTVLILHDFHCFLEDTCQDKTEILRGLKNAVESAKEHGITIMITGAKKVIPIEIEKLAYYMELSLPTEEELAPIVDNIAASAGIELNGETDMILSSLRGLTTLQADDTLALSLVQAGKFDPHLIAIEKANQIKKAGILEIIDAPASMDEIGGLEVVKSEIMEVHSTICHWEEAKAFNVPFPKGHLYLGLPGTGKSECVKALASYLNLPLISLNMGSVFGSLVGESEERIKGALDAATAMRPCVLRLDEIDKGIGGADGGNRDSGTTDRVLGTLFTWMQEQEGVFIAATANDPHRLSASDGAILRPGRFDKVFFVDLPHAVERKAIWNIHIKKHGHRNPEDFDVNTLVSMTESFTGAEIEQAVINAVRSAFNDYIGDSNKTKPEINDAYLMNGLSKIIPLAHTMADKIQGTRKWAKGRCIFASAAPSEVAATSTKKGTRQLAV